LRALAAQVLEIAGFEDAQHVVPDLLAELVVLAAIAGRGEGLGSLRNRLGGIHDLMCGALGAVDDGVQLARGTRTAVAECAGMQHRDLLLGAGDRVWIALASCWSWRSPSASILNAWRLASAAPPDAVDALIEPICSTRKPCVELAYVGCLQAGEDCPSAGALNMRFMGERDGSLAPFD